MKMQETTVVGNILPAAHLQALEADADALAECPNYWVPREVVEGSAPAVSVAEQAVQQLYRRLVQAQLAPHEGTWQGAEYWCQVYEGGRGLGFHFDKDEAVMAAEGRMVNPILSSVLYLTGSATDSVRQAPTVLIDQRFCQQQQLAVPDNPCWSCLVFPARNQYCLFPGDQAHGVLESMPQPQQPLASGTSRQAAQQQQEEEQEQEQEGQQQEVQQQGQRRVTFLVNWWTHRPESVVRATAGDVARSRLTAASNKLTLTPNCPPSDSCTHSNSTDDAADRLAALAVAEEAASKVDEKTNEQQAPPQPARLVRVQAPTLQTGNVLPIDELLSECGVCINNSGGSSGRQAASAVCIAHSGLTLVPLDEQQVDPAHPLQVLAALVPSGDLESDSSSEASSSKDGE